VIKSIALSPDPSPSYQCIQLVCEFEIHINFPGNAPAEESWLELSSGVNLPLHHIGKLKKNTDIK
jgi:hypothetical protein